jgi:hypothetical protein
VTALRVPLQINAPIGIVGQPVTVGVPFPRGSLREPERLCLADAEGKSVPLQVKPLARWADGSVKWLLCDFMLERVSAGCHTWFLEAGEAVPASASIAVISSADEVSIRTAAAFSIPRHDPLAMGTVAGNGYSLSLPHINVSGGNERAVAERLTVEEQGPVRVTVCKQVRIWLPGECVLTLRISFFAGTGLVRLGLTLRNPCRAKHKAGLWDLGDSASVIFDAFSLAIFVPTDTHRIVWKAGPDQETQLSERGSFTIDQASSGGSQWRSRVHTDRDGAVLLPFCGYKLRNGYEETTGDRASPVVSVHGAASAVTVAMPEFWQQFPRRIEAEGNAVRISLFPLLEGEPHEIQGGEQKSHTLWLHIGSASDTGVSLDWVHRSAVVLPDPAWTIASGVFHFLPAELANERCQTLLTEALEGPDNFFAKREAIDEYGWRHYGEVYADHENEHYTGEKPIVSHYNNQYDILNGFLTNFLRTGDPRWWALADPLARHIYDIDIYHTDRDRPAYNGGMFWHTDHYKDAGTATHRAYSKANKKPGQPYGGGPGNEHNWSTGLLHYYYFTGDPLAHEAVLSLANWVISRDDGKLTLLGLIDDGPTGLSSRTGGDGSYHGPGRGGGNSINSLLDAWQLTGERRYLDKAEELVWRCIHPADDLDALDMGNPEERWSYTVFLSVLVRYLELKREAGQADACYAYARASLLHYGRWMAKNEKPYFDQAERLEFPNETWAAQEMRKANVLRLAARYAEGAEREEMLRRGAELADRSWHDVFRFASRTSTRCLAILLTEGPRDSYLRTHAGELVTEKGPEMDFGAPSNFVPQRLRVKRQLKTAGGIVRAILRILDVRRWPRALRARQL